MKHIILPIMLVLLTSGEVRAQVNSGSTGNDGALDFSTITYNTNIVIDMHDHPIGIYNYTYVNIPANVAISFIPNANNTPVTWLVQSNVVINGTVNISGQTAKGSIGGSGGPGGEAGGSGGSNPQAGQGPGGGGAGFSVSNGNGTYYYYFGAGGSFGTQGNNVNIFGNETNSYSGLIYGNSFLLPLLGGSGGGGGGSAVGLGGGGGGGGGGAILIAASGFIQINGAISATAGGGNSTAGQYYNSYGGGGSGGGIRLVTVNFSGYGSLNAVGGNGSDGYGGAGRIRIDAFQNSFGGSISADPSTIFQGFQPIIIPTSGQGIQLNIGSVGGVVVSASPTGQLVTPDAILSAQQNNPIPVVVNCLNLPLNTAVTVTIKPANGSSVSAIGYNASGTQTSSMATISINMPRGGGLIYATAATGN